jgi:acyl-CoA thioesterase-1
VQRPASTARRRWLAGASSALLAVAGRRAAAQAPPGGAASGVGGDGVTLHTFGDSVLDCGRYNERGIHPGQLMVRNDDALFPEFRRRDLQSRGGATLEHHAVDGSTVDDLDEQVRGLRRGRHPVAIVTVGGNDLLRGLARDTGPGLKAFEATLDSFLRALAIRPVVLGTVYDPTFGDDSRNFLGVPADIARANHRRVNDIIAALAQRHGRLADLHGHFLRGDPTWFTRTIEPSLTGASEVRRVFLASLDLL